MRTEIKEKVAEFAEGKLGFSSREIGTDGLIINLLAKPESEREIVEEALQDIKEVISSFTGDMPDVNGVNLDNGATGYKITLRDLNKLTEPSNEDISELAEELVGEEIVEVNEKHVVSEVEKKQKEGRALREPTDSKAVVKEYLPPENQMAAVIAEQNQVAATSELPEEKDFKSVSVENPEGKKYARVAAPLDGSEPKVEYSDSRDFSSEPDTIEEDEEDITPKETLYSILAGKKGIVTVNEETGKKEVTITKEVVDIDIDSDFDKIERFTRLATSRTNKAIKAIYLVGNCSNKGNYEYNQEQVDKIINALEDAICHIKSEFFNEMEGKNIPTVEL